MRKAYFITGAAGGLGQAIIGTLADGRARVFAADIDRQALGSLTGREGVVPLLLDVTDEAGTRAARQVVAHTGPRLDGIVCAAGVYVGGPLLDLSIEEVRRAFEVNVMGAVTVVTELAPLLKRGARIVLLSSESTRVAVPFTGPYAMAKCALEAYADTLRRELAPLGIRVTVIQPGAIQTNLLKSAEQSLTTDSRRLIYRKGLISAARILARSAHKGLEPAAVAGVIAHALASTGTLRLRRVGNDPARALLSRLPAPLVDALVSRFL